MKNTTQFHIRPARPEEAGLFYTPHPEEDKRESVLKNRFAMERFCYDHGGKISGGWTQNYGYIVETEHYRYCLRCNPSPGDYNCYCTAYDLDAQRQNMAQSTGPDMTMGGLT